MSVSPLFDLNRTTASSFPLGVAASSARVGDDLFFTADDGLHVNGLWKTDGTTGGTVLVKEVGGPAALFGGANTSIGNLTSLGSLILFTVDDGSHGNELWVSDGTAQGTQLLLDILPGTNSSGVGELTVVGSQAFFTAEDGVHGRELWVTNGTTQGTRLVTDLDPGLYGEGSPQGLTAFKGEVYFSASNGKTGRELWASNGVRTRLVKDIRTGPDGAIAPTYPPTSSMAVLGNHLYFVADNGTTGQELWRTDGTRAGTRLVCDIQQGSSPGYDGSSFPSSSTPAELIAANGRLYFTAEDSLRGRQLWSSDGTWRGTRRETDLRRDPHYGADGDGPHNLTAAGGAVYFTGRTASGGEGLWAHQGGQTRFLREITPAGEQPFVILPWWGPPSQPLFVVNDQLFFAAVDPQHGRELWTTDGTAEGTKLVKDVRAGQAGSQLGFLGAIDDQLLFLANDGKTGRELWRSDAATGETQLVRDINQQGADSNPSAPVRAGKNLFFVADDGKSGSELWVSDPFGRGARMVRDIHQGFTPTPFGPGDTEPGGAGIHQLTAVGDLVFFVADDGVHGPELWRSDGTEKGTFLVRDIHTIPSGPNVYPLVKGSHGSQGSYPANLTVVNRKLYFTANDGVHGTELWVSDGTANGTHMVRDLNRQPGFGFPGPIPFLGAVPSVLAGSKSPFALGDPARIIWPGWGWGNQSSDPSELTVLGGKLYFVADDGVHGRELWTTNGTPEGTRLVRDIAPDASPQGPYSYPPPRGSNPSGLTRVGNVIYFSADDGASGMELWRTDGTSKGTWLVTDVKPGQNHEGAPLGSNPHSITAVGQNIYFAAEGPEGLGLWKSDGSPGNAELIRPFGATDPGNPFAPIPYVGELTAVGNRLFFVADDGTSGAELWVSDGSAEGTKLVKDLYPGSSPGPFGGEHPNASSPSHLTVVGKKVYFLATTPEQGRELWVSDGTAQGTALVLGVHPGAASGFNWFSNLTAIGDALHFSATDGWRGLEMYRLKG